MQIENPRQVSAFHYPRSYGPCSPSFSRATLLPWSDGARLLVSGTASIVGHATVFAGDTAAQLRQTAANLQALLEQAARRHGGCVRADDFEAESYTVYLRHEEDLAGIAAQLRELFGRAPYRVLGGDICRRELLIEVDAVFRCSAGPAN